MGKGLGNGYPVSVAACSPRVVARLEGRQVPYAQSHQNDPLGAAIALEVIRVIREEHLLERGRELSAVLRAGLESIRQRTGRIREVRGRGLMVAVELGDSDAAGRAEWVHRELVRRGFLVGLRPGRGVLRIDPALTVEQADLTEFLEVFEVVLQAPGLGADPQSA
jgi:acetylornithine aminotransferase